MFFIDFCSVFKFFKFNLKSGSINFPRFRNESFNKPPPTNKSDHCQSTKWRNTLMNIQQNTVLYGHSLCRLFFHHKSGVLSMCTLNFIPSNWVEMSLQNILFVQRAFNWKFSFANIWNYYQQDSGFKKFSAECYLEKSWGAN